MAQSKLIQFTPKQKRKTRQYAPSLVHHNRVRNGWLRLDPRVKAGLKAIARQEMKSINWVVEQVLIDYFKLEHSLRKKR